MTKDKLIEELGNLATRFSEGWHEGIKIDASDIMLFNQIAEALAQPEHHTLTSRVNDVRLHKERDDQRAEAMKLLAQPEQEPVAWYIREKDSVTTDGCWAEKNLDICEPLYTTPPQRTWVGLKDKEIYEATKDVDKKPLRVIVDLLEAKLKEKNNG